MSQNVLLALIVWAIARDLMGSSVTKVTELFLQDVEKSQRTAEQFADIVIEDAITDIRKFNISYGLYDNKILNYKRI